MHEMHEARECAAFQEVELHVTVEDDVDKYDLDVGSRVYIKAPASSFMAFSPSEVESTPLW